MRAYHCPLCSRDHGPTVESIAQRYALTCRACDAKADDAQSVEPDDVPAEQCATTDEF